MLTVETHEERAVGYASARYVAFVNNLMDDLRESISTVDHYRRSVRWYLDEPMFRLSAPIADLATLMARHESVAEVQCGILDLLLGDWFLSDGTPAERVEAAIYRCVDYLAAVSELPDASPRHTQIPNRETRDKSTAATVGKLVASMMSLRSSQNYLPADRPLTEGMLDRYEALAACVNGKASLLKRPGAERQ